MDPKSSKSKGKNKEKVNDSKIPELPDDILIMIFEIMSTEERHHLLQVSKRFRRVDLAIGKREFEEIRFEMNGTTDGIDAYLSPVIYKFKTIKNGDFEKISPGIHNFFKNTTVDLLCIGVASNRIGKLSLAPSSLFESLAFKNLFIHLQCPTDYSVFLLSFFSTLKNRQTDLGEIALHFFEMKYQNLPRLRETLRLLPNIRQIFIPRNEKKTRNEKKKEGRGKNKGNAEKENPHDFWLDGSTMLHLIRNSVTTYLMPTRCNAQELLEAFKMIRESGNKHVHMEVYGLSEDELFTLAELDDHLMRDEFGLVDLKRGYRLDLHLEQERSGQITPVLMKKIDV